MPGYHHTQVGWQVYGVCVPLICTFLYAGGVQDAQTYGLVLTITAVAFLLFGWLTVGIGERLLFIKFGIGLIRRSISLNTIRGIAPITNRWWYGWGIRFTPHGMLYNVAGFRAVELLLDDGRRVRIGTDEPDTLVRALQNATTVVPSKTVDEFPQDASWKRRTRVITATIVALTAALILGQVYLYSQPPSVEVTNGAFAVRSGLYGTEIPLSNIQSVELMNTLPPIQSRTNGYSAGGILRGNFRLERWGAGKLFINRRATPYLVIRDANTFVVVNFDDAVRTRELHERLSGAGK